MNYGPLEFAVWLRRKDLRESARVKAARAAAAAPLPPENRLMIVSGPHGLARMAPDDAATTASAAATPDVR